MKAFRTVVICALCVYSCGGPGGTAGSYGAGTPNSDGYYPSSDYFYWPTAQADGSTKWDAYSRRKEYEYSYSYGYRYPVSWKWVYYQVYNAPAYPQPQVELPRPSDPQWMNKMTDIIGLEIEEQAKIRKKQVEYAAWETGVKILGAEGILRNSRYANPVTTPHGQYAQYPPSFLLGPHGQTSNTLYAYKETDANYLGERLLDFNLAVQQSSSMVKNAGQVFGQGQTDFMGIVNQAIAAESERNDKLIALAKLKLAYQSLRPEPRAHIQSREFAFKQEAAPVPIPQPQPRGVARLGIERFMAEIARPDCGGCHNAQVKKGGFDIEDYPFLSMERKSKIWNERLLTTDPTKLMPKDQSGRGHRLPDERLQQYLLH